MTLSRSDLQAIALFSRLDDAALDALLPLLHAVRFAPGQTVLVEGEAGRHFYLIAEGRVKFLTHAENKEELVLGFAEAGEHFGELAMLTGAPRAARVVALEPTLVMALDFRDFEALLLRQPQAAIHVMQTLAARIDRSDTLLREVNTRNANAVDAAQMSFGDRISDMLANSIGSWAFIDGMSFILLLWVVWNSIAVLHNMGDAAHAWPAWDPYPFVFLNLGLSFLAAYSAPIIMMSQNRAAAKDRIAAEIDHDVNVKSELQIGQIVRRLDDLEKSIHHGRAVPAPAPRG